MKRWLTSFKTWMDKSVFRKALFTFLLGFFIGFVYELLQGSGFLFSVFQGVWISLVATGLVTVTRYIPHSRKPE